MPREIKFRFWNDVNKEMEIARDIWHSGMLLSNADDKHFIPMQFTGLKDKNGVDLFEGDIVRKYNEVNPEFGFETYKIEWSNTRACFHLQVTEELGIKDWGGYLLYKTSEKLEVIGNIWEGLKEAKI